MLANGVCHVRALTGGLCVIATHDTLLAGKLNNGLAHQVGLGKMCSSASMFNNRVVVVGISLREKRSDLLDTFNLLKDGSQFFLKNDVGKFAGKFVK